MSSVKKRTLDKPMQTKSLEQIFPEETPESGDGPCLASSGPALSPNQKLSSLPTGNDTFIDVEKEMTNKSKIRIAREPVGGRSESEALALDKATKALSPKANALCTEEPNTLITAPRPLRKSELETLCSSECDDDNNDEINITSKLLNLADGSHSKLSLHIDRSHCKVSFSTIRAKLLYVWIAFAHLVVIVIVYHLTTVFASAVKQVGFMSSSWIGIVS